MVELAAKFCSKKWQRKISRLFSTALKVSENRLQRSKNTDMPLTVTNDDIKLEYDEVKISVYFQLVFSMFHNYRNPMKKTENSQTRVSRVRNTYAKTNLTK